MKITIRTLAALVLALSLVAAGCGGDDSDDASSDTTEAGGGEAAACDPLPLKNEGTLTVATGEPAFPPWVEGPDAADTGEGDPYSGEGFESALVYAVAEQLGVAEGDVEWVRTGFDEAIAPGEKDYDFNIQQFGITPERDEVVDFSDGYYDVQQVVIAAEGSPISEATSVGELADFNLGAAIGTTSLDYIDEVIQPDTEAAVFDDNAAATAAFDAGQVDGIVYDLPTAYFITAVEIPDATIVGVLPAGRGRPRAAGHALRDGQPPDPLRQRGPGHAARRRHAGRPPGGVAERGRRHPDPVGVTPRP